MTVAAVTAVHDGGVDLIVETPASDVEQVAAAVLTSADFGTTNSVTTE